MTERMPSESPTAQPDAGFMAALAHLGGNQHGGNGYGGSQHGGNGYSGGPGHAATPPSPAHRGHGGQHSGHNGHSGRNGGNGYGGGWNGVVGGVNTQAAAQAAAGTVTLTAEQRTIVETALDTRRDIIVDACCGSGKTSTIQELVSRAAARGVKVLYLTYSKLLKLDAQARVHGAKVQNYHGIVYPSLKRAGITAGISESIAAFNRHFDTRLAADFPVYDLLVIDEYQDITEEYAQLLRNIKSQSPAMQVVMVGDIAQKVRSDTTLDAQAFAREFCEDPLSLPLTQSFRMGPEMAGLLSQAWNKPIIGRNEDQQVSWMSFEEAKAHIAGHEPGQVLCLGRRNGALAHMLNDLESEHGEIFNKNTVYATVRERGAGSVGDYGDHAAVFTTFDSAKGMERPLCVVFDYDVENWRMRNGFPGADAEVLRNIFLVAASRGKGEIVFVADDNYPDVSTVDGIPDEVDPATGEVLSWEHEPIPHIGGVSVHEFLELPAPEPLEYTTPVPVTDCFDFKYAENVQQAYRLLDVQRLDGGAASTDTTIEMQRSDGLIDLSAVIGNYQEALFFDSHDYLPQLYGMVETHSLASRAVQEIVRNRDRRVDAGYDPVDPWRESLLYTMAETGQARYGAQVTTSPGADEEQALMARLGRHLRPSSHTQVPVLLEGLLGGPGPGEKGAPLVPVEVAGYIDVVDQAHRAWELKFVSDVSYPMFLQIGTYVALARTRARLYPGGNEITDPITEGVLFNVYDGGRWRVRVPDPAALLDAVGVTLTKQRYTTLRPTAEY